MKTHTSSFKEQIKLIGKEIDSRITFGSTVLGKNDLNAVTPSYQGAILKSVMKQLDIDSNVAIPIGTILKYEFGLKVNGEYEYINYGNYIVYSVEKQEDTKSYKIVCYDKLLYSMLDYVKLPITYPISIRDYINSISTVLGLTFANKSDTFANYDKQIQADLYDGLGYTFRDILDELAQVTASTICLNENDELEIRYITETGDTIDEEFLKDVNVNFGEKFGAVNTIVLSRSGDSDSVYYPSVLPTNPYEIKISDNQIMNGNDRADFLPDIYNKLNGLEFYTNDFVSTGICYYDLCDRYSVKVGDNTYSCVMFNDEVLVTQGLEENIYTELPEQTETDYKHASKDDRMINQVYIIAKKNEAEILALVSTTETIQKEINPTKDESGSEITIEDASNNPLTYLEIEGKSEQDGTPTPDIPLEIESVGYENLLDISKITENLWINATGDTGSSTITNTSDYIKIEKNKTYCFSYNYETLLSESGKGISLYDENKNVITGGFNYLPANKGFTITPSQNGYIRFSFDKNCYNIQLEKGSTAHPYIPYGKYGIEVETIGKNLFNIHDVEWGKYNVYNNEAGNYSNAFISYVSVKPNTIYSLSALSSNTFRFSYQFLDTNGRVLSGFYNSYTETSHTFENLLSPSSATKILISQLDVSQNDDIKVQLEENKISTEIEEYKSNTSLIVLNAPLRSLPNGVKDIAYIRNNKLYVDRYVGSVVLDGSENWSVNNTDGQNTARFYLSETTLKNASVGYCNNNKYVTSGVSEDNQLVGKIGGTLYYRIDKNIVETIEEFKTWLSTNNVEIVSELATPVTEELGEIEMLKTLKGYNDISTTDELLPIINLTYVRDTIIADYVENHVTELKLAESEIKASVESVSSSVDGLNTTINRVEEITTDNSQVINVISTNIDRTSGEVREVTTTTGFTFNADGMTIDDGSGFKAEHTADGTYYKDGNSIVGQYTKDGSKQKDLELFGTYSYGKESINDTPMFVGQLYTDENGEQGFGHFYNGEG